MMDGYLGDENGYQPVDKRGLRSWLITILCTLAYMIPLFWMWGRTGFPDSLGVHITAHGKAGLLENWYYSYLLLERHQVLDVITFAYMWLAVAAVAVLLIRALQKDRRAKEASVQSLGTPSIFDAEEADERRRKVLVAIVISLAFGALLIAIMYFKGA